MAALCPFGILNGIVAAGRPHLQISVDYLSGLLYQRCHRHTAFGDDPPARFVPAHPGIRILASQEATFLQHEQAGARHVVTPGDVVPDIHLLDRAAMVDVQQDGGGVLLLQNLDAGQPFRFRFHGKVDNVPLNVTFVKSLDLCQFLGSAFILSIAIVSHRRGTAAKGSDTDAPDESGGDGAASGERATGGSVGYALTDSLSQVMEENP